MTTERCNANRNIERHNNNTQRDRYGWFRFALNSAVAVSIVGGAWYYYKYYHLKPQPRQQPTEDDAPMNFQVTPLGDFDDTDDTNNNDTTFYCTPGNEAGDGKKMNFREEYISQLLQQRRFSSVLCNNHLNHHREEFYFHLGFGSSSPLLSHFNRVKWVIIVKSASDVKLVARRILNEFPQFVEEKNDNELPKPIGSTDRFYMLQIASIIIVSCGIGGSSISILLQEVKLKNIPKELSKKKNKIKKPSKSG